MAVHFLLGRAGTGKTEFCLRAVTQASHSSTADAADNPAAHRRIVLVPEQASLQMEQAIVARSPRLAYTGVDVVSFSTLAARLFEETGGDPVRLTATGRRMALCRLLDDATIREPFGAAAEKPGFLRGLDDLITQLIQADLTPHGVELLAAAQVDEAVRRQLGAVARLFAAYRDWLGPLRIDPAEFLRALRERLDRVAWLREAELWVDGFAGFSGQETATLVELCVRVRQATIALLLDGPDVAAEPGLATRGPAAVDDLFTTTRVTYAQLAERLRMRRVAIGETRVLTPRGDAVRFQHCPDVARIAEVWERGDDVEPAAPLAAAGPSRPAATVQVVAAPSPRDEVAAAAAYIRARVAASDGRVRFGDFAVIARTLGPLADVVRNVFAEYGVPHFIDERRPLRVHPFARALDALLEAALDDLPASAMIALLQTELVIGTRRDAETLENIVRTHAVRGVRSWAPKVAWAFADDRWLRRREDADDVAPAAERAFDAVDRLRFAMFGAIDALRGPYAAGVPQTGAQWAENLYTALHRIGAIEQLNRWIVEAENAGKNESASLHRATWEAVRETLEDLHAVLGDQPLTLPLVADLIRDAIESRTIAVAPPTVDQVLVGGIERSRQPELREVWLLGWNDGIFPLPPSETTLLVSAARSALWGAGVETLAPAQEAVAAERWLAYIALTRASERLHISYATADATGEPIPRSRFLSPVFAALPGLASQAWGAGEPVSLPDVARGVLTSAAPPSTPAAPRWAALRRRIETSPLGAALGFLLRGELWPRPAPPVGLYVRPPRVPGLAWQPSPTEIEAYLQCPFRHFLQYGLRLDPLREPRSEHLDIGSAAHAVLADVTRHAMRGKLALTPEAWEAAVPGALDRYRATLPAGLAQRQPRLAYLLGVLEAFVRERVRSLVAAWNRGEFRPFAAERAVGEADVPLALLEAAGDVRVGLRGSIDRVDVATTRDGHLLLVRDYKSSPEAVQTRSDVLIGGSLQVWLYVLAVHAGIASRGNAGGGPGYRVAGVLVDPLYPSDKCIDNKYYEQATAENQPLFMYRPRGTLLGEAADRLDTLVQAGEESPVGAIKRTKGKAGEPSRFYKNADVVPPAGFEERLAQARETLRYVAAGVLAGQIAPSPLLHKRVLACHKCPFGERVCRYERGRAAPRIALNVLPRAAGEPSGGECEE